MTKVAGEFLDLTSEDIHYVVAPFADEELYARLDAFEWRRDVQQSETLRGSGYKLRIDPITETALSA